MIHANDSADASTPQPVETVRRRSRTLRKGSVALALSLGVLALGAFKLLERVSSRRHPVAAYRIRRGTLRDSVSAVSAGRVGARRELSLRAAVGGTVVKLHHRRGDVVEAGAPLVTLEASELEDRIRLDSAGLVVAEAQAAEADARARLAQSRARTAALLLRTNAVPSVDAEVSESELRIAQRSALVARAVVNERKEALAVANRNLQRAEVRAPCSGVVLSLDSQEGELVSPGTPLVRFADVGELHVEAYVDQADAHRIRVGMPVELSFEQAPDAPVRKTLSEIAPAVETGDARGARRVAIRVDLGGDRYTVGATAELDIVVSERTNAFILPASAFLGTGKERDVLVIRDGVLQRQSVEVGTSSYRGIEVTKGLKENELVALAPSSIELADGEAVDWEERDTPVETR